MRTDRGIEVAFVLDCPTAARMVVDGAAPFLWAQLDVDDWEYPPFGAVGSVVRWSDEQTASFEAVEALREAWWQRLNPLVVTPSASDLHALLTAMILTPSDPSPSVDALPALATDGVGAQLVGLLSRLPGRGDIYQREDRALADRLDRTPSDPTWLARVPELAAFACAATVLVQQAGVHDQWPALTRIQRTGEHLLLAMRLAAIASTIEAVAEDDAATDALVVTAQVHRFQQSGQMLLTD